MKQTILTLCGFLFYLQVQAQVEPVAAGAVLLKARIGIARSAEADRVGKGAAYVSYIIHNGDSIPFKRVPRGKIRGAQRATILSIETTLSEAKTLYLANDMEGLVEEQDKLALARTNVGAVELIRPKWNVAPYKAEIAFYESLIHSRQTLARLVSDIEASNARMAAERELRATDEKNRRAEQAETRKEHNVMLSSSLTQTEGYYQYVNASKLNLREWPSTSAKVLVSLDAASRIEVVEELGEWRKVKALGREGYLSASYLVNSLEDVTAGSAELSNVSYYPKPAAAAKRRGRAAPSTFRSRPAASQKNKAGTVYYCNSGNVVKYHRSANCRGLNRCKAAIEPISLAEASNYMNPCKFCY